jgi:glycerol-3-phosphate dehydrogenase (NAD(P)+)
VLAEVLPAPLRDRIVVLAGPSHAEEVARRIPTLIVAASRDAALAQRTQEAFHTEWLRIYTNDDVAGVEIGVALKNVIAIAAGIADGLGFGDSTKAALLTRGLAEMGRLAAKLGARPETLSGLAGMGDLIATAGSRHSRNRRFGEAVGRGATVKEAPRCVADGRRGRRDQRRPRSRWDAGKASSCPSWNRSTPSFMRGRAPVALFASY